MKWKIILILNLLFIQSVSAEKEKDRNRSGTILREKAEENPRNKAFSESFQKVNEQKREEQEAKKKAGNKSRPGSS